MISIAIISFCNPPPGRDLVRNTSWRIDFEACDLGDPMWDLAYLIVNLELEHHPYKLADLYGVTPHERVRVGAYIQLALAHCATWAAMRGGGPWVQHYKELMERLHKVLYRKPGRKVA